MSKKYSSLVKMTLRADRLEKEFPVGSVWAHHSGRKYVVRGVANIANWNAKYRPAVVYTSLVPTENALLPSRLWTKWPSCFRNTMKRVDTYNP